MSSAAYHHGNLRAALVETGLAMARESGPDGVALREVARRVGVSHNAAYRHFADRDRLLAEIAGRGMEMLTEAMQARLATVPAGLDDVERARARLREVGHAYVQFALDEPGLFRTAFTAHPAGDEAQAEAETDGGPYTLLNEILDELVEAGFLAAERRPGAEIACWAGVHGFAVLHLEGPVRETPPPEREAALASMLAILDLGLGAEGKDTPLAHVVNER